MSSQPNKTMLHHIFNRPLETSTPKECQAITVAMGCFWGAERLFWQQDGVYLTMVGYSAGTTENPTYKDVCTDTTDHAEVVRVIFDPKIISLNELLALFWQNHIPTQGMRQGNDIGSQYRSAIYPHNSEDLALAEESLKHYQQALIANGDSSPITTEIKLVSEFFLAEEEHQQYLSKNPAGYCGLGGSGVCYPA
ncbi:peptide-methionine (S)-S-oxide reductase MsrA [Vibrio sp. SS-MA-C1-2]|uniref:peptide-methionine (S)-S-oxide reductase MsrA n=1 Tax=Vibrio sp. SS-MA-C1-2 TaxID=2908646 RepID=UPI001F28225A|nr:peptide-methionine (S)-S-oxide reductase MsrA [Vibrio sp. SS-MA-C1-2]UJF19510.1 peptide-methionine (S)-S-oxide reductase MsrA [Vibrio sp. SS-MA-C1-2]